jgi:drug/metabolite transporter (DMT)-like permease
VVGFPLFLALALREVDAMHAAVVTGVLPLATAAVARWPCASGRRRLLGLRAGRAARWWWAMPPGRAARRLTAADGLLLLAVLLGRHGVMGYVAGAAGGGQLPAAQVICWVLVLSLPLTLPLALVAGRRQPASAAAWGGFAYVSLFSMWLGFFAWYRGLALGGMLRVSQVQLLQPFLALLLPCRCWASGWSR